jgi:DUF1680 family protein
MSKFIERRMPKLSKTRYVLDLDTDRPDGDRVQFTSEEDPRVIPSLALRLDAAEWQALGSPEVITVTVEPGDLLNEEEPTNG